MRTFFRLLAAGSASSFATAVAYGEEKKTAELRTKTGENEKENVDSEKKAQEQKEVLNKAGTNIEEEKSGKSEKNSAEQQNLVVKNEKSETKENENVNEVTEHEENKSKSGEAQAQHVSIKAHDHAEALKQDSTKEQEKENAEEKKTKEQRQAKYSPHTQKELLANPGLNAQVAVSDIMSADTMSANGIPRDATLTPIVTSGSENILPGHQAVTSELAPTEQQVQANAAAVAGVVNSVDPSQADLNPPIPAIVGDGNPNTAQVIPASQGGALPPGVRGIETRNENGEPVIIIPPQTRRRGLAPIVLEPGSISLAKAKEVLDDMERQRTWWDFFVNLASGTGARTLNGHELQIKAGSGISERQLEALRIEKALVKRMNVQDLAVLVLLAMIYFVTLCFGWSIVYRMSGNASSVTYYSDPRYHPLVSDAADVEGISTDFDIPPVRAYLQVVGWEKTPSSHGVVWRGGRWQVAFQFALDLTTFLEKSAEFSDEDGEKIQDFLTTNNHLAQLVIQKQTHWPGFEELAQNIKKRMKAAGPTVLPGSSHVVNMDNVVIDVQLKGDDEVTIFQNKTWSNFMHNRTTKTLFILSVVGAVFYFPYMWLRCTKTYVKSFYRVNNSVTNFWELIDSKLHPAGRECFLNPNAAGMMQTMGGGTSFGGGFGSTMGNTRSPSGFGGFGGQPGMMVSGGGPAQPPGVVGGGVPGDSGSRSSSLGSFFP